MNHMLGADILINIVLLLHSGNSLLDMIYHFIVRGTCMSTKCHNIVNQ
jgi:hypothetical protein